jgi:glycine cleavage system transcriptional repressor
MAAMREGLIIAAVGQDRPGIVDRLSGAIFKVGCNLEDSRMAILGGEFALVVLVSGPRERLEEARRELARICEELGFTVQFKKTQAGPPRPEPAGRISYLLSAVALDQPGIVHKVTHLLSEHQVNVATLETRVSHAPDSGTPVFSLELLAQVPAKLPIARLRQALRDLSDAENIDLDLRAVP